MVIQFTLLLAFVIGESLGIPHICMLQTFEASQAKSKPFHQHDLTDIGFLLLNWTFFSLIDTMSKLVMLT